MWNLTSCLDKTIPAMASTNEEYKKIEKENKEIKGKVQCIERDDDDIRVLCIYIVQDNINIIEYEIDNDEIEKEKVKLINDSDNQKYITSKLESLNKNEIIICGITTGNKISCFILNNELLLMKYKEEIIINCDISILEISIINEERFLVICENIVNNSLLVKEDNYNFNSLSRMMTIDISNHKIHYLVSMSYLNLEKNDMKKDNRVSST